jgi:hypothetical protein
MSTAALTTPAQAGSQERHLSHRADIHVHRLDWGTMQITGPGVSRASGANPPIAPRSPSFAAGLDAASGVSPLSQPS